MSRPIIVGRCLCSAVQFELTAEAQMQGLCYCTDCQTVGGSSHWTSYAVAPESFHLVMGAMTAYTYDPGAGREVTRHFCVTCGTQIMVHSDALGVASINAMTFDDPTVFEPQVAYFGDSAPKWCEINPGLAPFAGE